jgi:Ca2+-binding RTX toxin-like protein
VPSIPTKNSDATTTIIVASNCKLISNRKSKLWQFFDLTDDPDIKIFTPGELTGRSVRGLGGNDSIEGSSDAEEFNGNSGNDIILGRDGNDLIRGGQGNDSLAGNNGEDVLNGNAGADFLNGEDQSDILRGGQGNDVVAGEPGDDILIGDRGTDLLVGGSGADIFILRTDPSSNYSWDYIADFDVSENDRIGLTDGLIARDIIFQGTSNISRSNLGSIALSFPDLVTAADPDGDGFLVGTYIKTADNVILGLAINRTPGDLVDRFVNADEFLSFG